MRARGRLARQRFVSYPRLECSVNFVCRKRRRKPTRRSKILGGFLETLRIVCPPSIHAHVFPHFKVWLFYFSLCKDKSILVTGNCFRHTFEARAPAIFGSRQLGSSNSQPLLNPSPPICTKSRHKSKLDMSQQEQQLEEEGEEGFGPVLVTKLQVNA
jgi:hypothetical protein